MTAHNIAKKSINENVDVPIGEKIRLKKLE